VEEARAMTEAAKAAGIIHMVAFNYRRTPAVALAKKYIDEGRIGRILNFRGTYLQDWSADENGPLSWRFQKKIAGSGAVGDIGTHVVDLAHYLVGPIAEVIAMTKTYVTSRPIQQGGVDKLGASEKSADAERAPVDVDDEVVSMLRFGNGAIGSLEATRNAWGRNNFITLEIHGTKGSIHFNYERRDELQVMFADDPADARGFRTVYTGPAHPYGGGLWPIPGLGIGYSETKIVECFDLFNAIATGKQPSPNFEDGLLTELVADALLRSGESGKWEQVE
jgi:predicted dehydrogenase